MLEPDDQLFIPLWRRLVHEEETRRGEVVALTLYHSDKEICFDEPRIVGFGRGLLRHETFRAGATRRWADGEPYSWDTVKGMLETLIQEGIVQRAGEARPPPGEGEPSPERRSTGPPGVEPVERPDLGRCWSRADDRCAELGQHVFGVPFGLDRLEFFIPVIRVAHPAVDVEGRQVGEANVRPG